MTTNLTFYCRQPKTASEYINLGRQQDVNTVPRRGEFVIMRLNAEYQKQLNSPHPDGCFEITHVIWSYGDSVALVDIYMEISGNLILALR